MNTGIPIIFLTHRQAVMDATRCNTGRHLFFDLFLVFSLFYLAIFWAHFWSREQVYVCLPSHRRTFMVFFFFFNSVANRHAHMSHHAHHYKKTSRLISRVLTGYLRWLVCILYRSQGGEEARTSSQTSPARWGAGCQTRRCAAPCRQDEGRWQPRGQGRRYPR